MDHVRNHLDLDLSLDALAAVAGFSPFHFHRMFKEVAGETVAQFTRRARLERAVDLMRGAPGRSLASIGSEVGFATPSEFSRVFKGAFGIAPSQWDRRSRMDGESGFASVDTIAIAEAEVPVVLRRRPALLVTCIRIRDPWIDGNVQLGYRELQAQVLPAVTNWGLATLVGLSWQSGTVTPLDRLTYDLGVVTPIDETDSKSPPSYPQTRGADRPVVRYQLPAVTAAEIHAGSLQRTALAWETLYQEWLPGSGFEPADHPAIKFFRTVPEELTPQSWNVDCSVAVRRALHRS